MKLKVRVDITLYPTVWESSQKLFLEKILELQNKLIVNVVYESLPDLKNQINMLLDFFRDKGIEHVTELLQTYAQKIKSLISEHPNCDERLFTTHMGDNCSRNATGLDENTGGKAWRRRGRALRDVAGQDARRL